MQVRGKGVRQTESEHEEGQHVCFYIVCALSLSSSWLLTKSVVDPLNCDRLLLSDNKPTS